MFATALQAGCKAKKFCFFKTVDRDDIGEFRLADGKCSGFIDDQSVDICEPFQHLRVLDQHAGLCTTSRCNHD